MCLQRTELFLDVNEIPIVKKEVRPISDQDEMESRRLWKEVTAGLRYVLEEALCIFKLWIQH